nr:uncharacterized protein LOC109168302 [Ipomoea batatas]
MSSPRELLSDDYTYNSREEGYGGLSTGLMVLCIIIIYLSCIYFCKICRSCGSPPTAEAVAVPTVAVAVGLDEAILRSFPKVVYSKAKGSGKYSIASTGCSICLDDYKEKDVGYGSKVPVYLLDYRALGVRCPFREQGALLVQEYHKRLLELACITPVLVPTEASKIEKVVASLNLNTRMTLVVFKFRTLSEAVVSSIITECCQSEEGRTKRPSNGSGTTAFRRPRIVDTKPAKNF